MPLLSAPPEAPGQRGLEVGQVTAECRVPHSQGACVTVMVLRGRSAIVPSHATQTAGAASAPVPGTLQSSVTHACRGYAAGSWGHPPS